MSSIDNRENKAIEVVATAAGGLHAVKSAAKEAAHEVIRETASRSPQAKTRKSARTRAKIMDAAYTLMRERGSMDFQMSEVSERCGMSKGSVYYYFADHDALTKAIFSETFSSFAERLNRVATQAPDAVAALKAIGHEFARSCAGSDPLAMAMGAQVVAGSSSDRSTDSCVALVQQIVVSQLERGKREGSIREDLDSEETALFAVGGALMSALYSTRRDAPQRDAGIDAFLEGALRGVGAREAAIP